MPMPSLPSLPPDIEPLMVRGHQALEVSAWNAARVFFDGVLGLDSQHAPAYVGLLLTELQIQSEEDLGKHHEPISGLRNFQRAIRYADAAYKATLEGYDEKIRERIRQEEEQIEQERREAEEQQERIRQEAEARAAARAAGETITYYVGSDFYLYGRTLGNTIFDWENLRGTYVLVKFTATWCGPCRRQIPGMLEAYATYRDKGFEIVSVYIWERGTNPVATVRQAVAQDRLPWIILSETLTERAGQPPQGRAFDIRGVPTMVLVDKEGKVIAIGTNYRQELRRIFGE